MQLREQVPLAPLTTFEIGGPAQYFAEAAAPQDVREAVLFAREHNLRLTILSGGSNVVIPDSGIQGFVLRIVEGSHLFSDNVLTADAGCNLLSLIRAAAAERYGGWERLAGIPGSIGGAVRGNAGAFGSEIKDFVTVVRALHSETLESTSFVNPYMTFGYRESSFKREPKWIITSVTVELTHTKREESERLIKETLAERERRHLQNVRAAGSFFMNPIAPREVVALFEQEKSVKAREGRVPAGWLIEKAGMKGATVGGAIASEQHPNYLVNQGGATAHDVLNLAQMIKLEVFNKFGVELQEEAAIFQ
jgi:UDP-N-acetylmuramate dehydrogenase